MIGLLQAAIFLAISVLTIMVYFATFYDFSQMESTTERLGVFSDALLEFYSFALFTLKISDASDFE
jgi:hypothetical protein